MKLTKGLLSVALYVCVLTLPFLLYQERCGIRDQAANDAQAKIMSRLPVPTGSRTHAPSDEGMVG